MATGHLRLQEKQRRFCKLFIGDNRHGWYIQKSLKLQCSIHDVTRCIEPSYCKRGSIHKKIWNICLYRIYRLLYPDILYMTPHNWIYYCYCCSGEVAHKPPGFYCVFLLPEQTIVLQSIVHAFRSNYNLNALGRNPRLPFRPVYIPL